MKEIGTNTVLVQKEHPLSNEMQDIQIVWLLSTLFFFLSNPHDSHGCTYYKLEIIMLLLFLIGKYYPMPFRHWFRNQFLKYVIENNDKTIKIVNSFLYFP